MILYQTKQNKAREKEEKVDKNEKLEIGTDNIKNFGYSALSKIYYELEIDKFLIGKFKEAIVSCC